MTDGGHSVPTKPKMCGMARGQRANLQRHVSVTLGLGVSHLMTDHYLLDGLQTVSSRGPVGIVSALDYQ